jgi:tRNA uridine 5-carbamoylmethylation protein Kti12
LALICIVNKYSVAWCIYQRFVSLDYTISMTQPTTSTTWQDPIMQELHALREQLVAQYNGAIA